ncbi:MAG: hypothetical protein FRX48_02879 [Lasallia pustulata]|uniref:Uncharacterized protein n=1 Tax=Lasallia pustulata TaxID=136370 RepID=A0A5M8PWQ1_9LECA|nr:MAG: hypothetical protein FRX48_02879 [Lasallia pustulata]
MFDKSDDSLDDEESGHEDEPEYEYAFSDKDDFDHEEELLEDGIAEPAAALRRTAKSRIKHTSRKGEAADEERSILPIRITTSPTAYSFDQ